MMRAHAEMTPDELREAGQAAGTLISENFQRYLPGRMLAMLLGHWRRPGRHEPGSRTS
jgi:hypothetical protein